MAKNSKKKTEKQVIEDINVENEVIENDNETPVIEETTELEEVEVTIEDTEKITNEEDNAIEDNKAEETEIKEEPVKTEVKNSEDIKPKRIKLDRGFNFYWNGLKYN